MRNLKGKVTMELSEVTRMLDRIRELEEKFEKLFGVENAWSNRINVSFSIPVIESEIRSLVAKKFPGAKFEDYVFDEYSNCTYHVANLPSEDEEEDQ